MFSATESLYQSTQQGQHSQRKVSAACFPSNLDLCCFRFCNSSFLTRHSTTTQTSRTMPPSYKHWSPPRFLPTSTHPFLWVLSSVGLHLPPRSHLPALLHHHPAASCRIRSELATRQWALCRSQSTPGRNTSPPQQTVEMLCSHGTASWYLQSGQPHAQGRSATVTCSASSFTQVCCRSASLQQVFLESLTHTGKHLHHAQNFKISMSDF